MKHLAPLLLLGLLLSMSTACSSTPTPGEPTAWSKPIGQDKELIYEQCIMVLEEHDYQIDRDKSIRGSGKLLTLWNEELAPFRFQGQRRRVHLTIERVPAPEGTKVNREPYRIGVNVEVQRNENIDDPMNPGLAEWEPTTERDETFDDRMMYWLEQSFRSR